MGTGNPFREYYDNLSTFELKHAPEELFWEGDFSLLTDGRRVSVVGSRAASRHGIARAEVITAALVEQGIVVVSGLAAGIDTIAHKTAISLVGRTVAVLGTPLSKAYPAENKGLLSEIKGKHLAVSQFVEGRNYGKQAFPIRNRTMALISDATIIIEAGEISGTRHQGWEALRLGRMVFLLENVANDLALTWPKEMMKYGAQVMTRENHKELIADIPNFTSHAEFSF